MKKRTIDFSDDTDKVLEDLKNDGQKYGTVLNNLIRATYLLDPEVKRELLSFIGSRIAEKNILINADPGAKYHKEMYERQKEEYSKLQGIISYSYNRAHIDTCSHTDKQAAIKQ